MLLLQNQADMVSRVAWGMDDSQGSPVNRNNVSVVQLTYPDAEFLSESTSQTREDEEVDK